MTGKFAISVEVVAAI